MRQSKEFTLSVLDLDIELSNCSDLKKRRSLCYSMFSSAPPHHKGIMSNKMLSKSRKTNRDDVFLEDDILLQSDQGHVVTEVCRTVQRMDVFGLDLKVLMR